MRSADFKRFFSPAGMALVDGSFINSPSARTFLQKVPPKKILSAV